MADTKISALTAVSSVADANEFGSNEDVTSRKLTGSALRAYLNTAPVFAAGTASAGTWPKLTTGTLLTTPEAGALEFSTGSLFATGSANARGVICLQHFCFLTANYTLTSTTTEQKLFNATANGRLTLPVGTYFFDCNFSITSMSATSGNLTFDLLGAGTATLGTVLYFTNAVDNTIITSAATDQASFQTAAQAAGQIATAGTGTALGAFLAGSFRVTASGSIVPSVALATAAAAIVTQGSYFRCYRVGDENVTTVGNWD